MNLKRRDIERALERKGFKRTESDHSFFVYYTQAGIKTIARTKTSHGKGGEDIGAPLISRMAKQCKLTSDDFRQLVDCRLSRKGYEKKLKLKVSGSVGSSGSAPDKRRRARRP